MTVYAATKRHYKIFTSDKVVGEYFTLYVPSELLGEPRAHVRSKGIDLTYGLVSRDNAWCMSAHYTLLVLPQPIHLFEGMLHICRTLL
jgi:hypothetical protein